MLEVLNPATEEVVEKLEPATGEDAAVARARKAFPKLRDLEPSDRSRLLRRLADALDNSKTSVRIPTPFGGMKQSGVGRELGPHALDYYTETKNVYISTEED